MFFVIDTYFHFVYGEAIAQQQGYVGFQSHISYFGNTQESPKYGTLAMLSLINCCFLNYYLTVSI